MSGLEVSVLVATFLLILPAELPDKTFVATLVLSTRLRPWTVWLGVASAFAVQCTVAVVAGGLLSLLPSRVVSGAAAVLFGIGALIMLRGGLIPHDAALESEAHEEEEVAEQVTGRIGANVGSLRSVATAFGVLFAAEWGDLSQLLTAGQAARTGQPLEVWLGAWLALVTVGTLAIVMGRWLQQRVPLERLRLVSAAVLAVLCVISMVETIRG